GAARKGPPIGGPFLLPTSPWKEASAEARQVAEDEGPDPLPNLFPPGEGLRGPTPGPRTTHSRWARSAPRGAQARPRQSPPDGGLCLSPPRWLRGAGA